MKTNLKALLVNAKTVLQQNLKIGCYLLPDKKEQTLGKLPDTITAEPSMFLTMVGTGEIKPVENGNISGAPDIDVTCHVVAYLAAKKRLETDNSQTAGFNGDFSDAFDTDNPHALIKLSQALSFIPQQRFDNPMTFPAVNIECLDLYGLDTEFKPDNSSWRLGLPVLSRAKDIIGLDNESDDNDKDNTYLWAITWEQVIRLSPLVTIPEPDFLPCTVDFTEQVIEPDSQTKIPSNPKPLITGGHSFKVDLTAHEHNETTKTTNLHFTINELPDNGGLEQLNEMVFFWGEQDKTDPKKFNRISDISAIGSVTPIASGSAGDVTYNAEFSFTTEGSPLTASAVLIYLKTNKNLCRYYAYSLIDKNQTLTQKDYILGANQLYNLKSSADTINPGRMHLTLGVEASPKQMELSKQGFKNKPATLSVHWGISQPNSGSIPKSITEIDPNIDDLITSVPISQADESLSSLSTEIVYNQAPENANAVLVFIETDHNHHQYLPWWFEFESSSQTEPL